jgi:single-stranded-DNA-specific exonuclease
MLAKELTLSLIKELDTLAPFGEGNRPPLFAIEQVKITDMRQVGKNKKHLKLKLDADGVYIDAIGFSMGDMLSDLSYNNVYDIAFNLGANEWNGFEQVELTLVDIKAKEPK